MKRLSVVSILLVVAFTVFGCATHSGPGWVTLIDGDRGLENFNRIGDANWRAEGGVIVADKGKGGQLVTKNSYKDFEIYAEFWADTTTNSGIFIRATDPKKIGADNAYEVNIYDQRPGQEYGTGAIVNFAQVPVPNPYKAGGKWNTLEIHARGPEVTVKMNGVVTTKMNNGKFPAGPFSLQFGNGPNDAPGGAIKWRAVRVHPL
ncbi:MAG TPA: DUF1080 domain-containing protein [Burkholderiales bacterium]|nr:DUF1080 domain-containing protein [Burkholderiales bacterium]